MKKILIPCDFSKPAIEAFRLAIDVAKKSRSEIHLVNVIELPVLHDSFLMPVLYFEKEFFKDLTKKTNERFDELITTYKVEGFKTKIKTDVLFGGVLRMTIDYMKKNKIDIIIMGTHGAKGVRETMIGSNAEKIIRNSPVPVIAIKKYIPVEKIKSIVFPNTPETEDQKGLVTRVKALQHFFKAKLHIVFVNTPANFTPDRITLNRLSDFAKRFLLKDFSLNTFNATFEESGIIDFTKSIRADLIAMGTHGRRGISYTLNGSVAEDVANHVDCPIWTSRIEK